jgi:hypothetical protein
VTRPLLAAAATALLACQAAAPLPSPAPLAAAEAAFLETRTAADRINVRLGRGDSWDDLLAGYRAARQRMLATLAALDTAALAGGDRAAVRAMRETAATQLQADPAPVVGDAGQPAEPSCQYEPATLLRDGGAPALSARIMACYGREAARIPYGERTLDRLTIFGLLGTTADRSERERLFHALAPVWASVNGGNSADSPWRVLLASRAEGWRDAGLPHVARARALGISPDSVEIWLERVLTVWRAAQPDTVLEPWDWYHYTGAASRRLESRVPLDRLRRLNDQWYRRLGADPAALLIQYDLEPRAGKYPVAYTTFGARPAWTGAEWSPGEPFVSAAYRIGGLDNLVELLHETGHAIHIAGIRTRPAWADWPDSDTFTEAVADLVSHDAFEPRWQWGALGDSVPLAEGLRAKYGGVVLDMAWALFEMRMFRDPAQDPNRVWAEVTGTFLRIRPHPEWSWWAMRGQLIESPGYMLNYALGGILTAALRSRIATERGEWLDGDPGWYPWVRERLFQFGASRPAAEVIREYLGGALTPGPVLADLARARR